MATLILLAKILGVLALIIIGLIAFVYLKLR